MHEAHVLLHFRELASSSEIHAEASVFRRRLRVIWLSSRKSAALSTSAAPNLSATAGCSWPGLAHGVS
jgi:hypothetical protein